MFLIYKHTAPNGKAYIGQTNNLHRRNTVHKNTAGCRAFAAAIKKYGWESFAHEVLVDGLTLEEANRLEPELIANHNTMSPNGYNLRSGGESPAFSDETRKKLSDAAKERRLDSKQRKRLSELGKQLPRERFAKMVEGARKAALKRTGDHHNLGRKHGDHHRLKTGVASKMHWQDPEYRAKVIASRTGQKRSDETKSKIAAAAKARWERHRKEKEAAQGDLFVNQQAD